MDRRLFDPFSYSLTTVGVSVEVKGHPSPLVGSELNSNKFIGTVAAGTCICLCSKDVPVNETKVDEKQWIADVGSK